MALIQCRECGKEISDKATKCIHCGCPVESAEAEYIENISNYRSQKFRKPRRLIGSFLVILIILLVAIIIVSNNSDANPYIDNPKYTIPHNSDIVLIEPKDSVIKKDDLIKDEDDNARYVTKNNITLNGYTTLTGVSYTFENNKIDNVMYIFSDLFDNHDLDEIYVNLKEYFSDIYGEYEELISSIYWTVIFDDEEKFTVYLAQEDIAIFVFIVYQD